MLRLALFATAVVIASPVLAEGVTLTIRNESSHALTRLNTFAVDDNLTPVEDNLGAISEDIPAGATGHLKLYVTACQPVYVAAGLEGQTDDITATINTCKSQTLVVSD